MAPHVFKAMGTVVSLTLPERTDLPERKDSPERTNAADAVDAVARIFAEFDARYSLYRPDSELSLLARGELSLTASSNELRSTYAASLRWRDETCGAFTPHRPDGVIDLNGTVKALAMQAAADELLRAGFSNWCH